MPSSDSPPVEEHSRAAYDLRFRAIPVDHGWRHPFVPSLVICGRLRSRDMAIASALRSYIHIGGSPGARIAVSTQHGHLERLVGMLWW